MRLWMHIGVGVFLLAVLVSGGVLINYLNKDARELVFNDEQALRGQTISTNEGCIACHTIDGSPGIGPTWLGMFGKTELLTDGQTVVVDEDYFRESIRNPARKLVEGYPNVMLRYILAEDEVEALIAFARQLEIPQAD